MKKLLITVILSVALLASTMSLNASYCTDVHDDCVSGVMADDSGVFVTFLKMMACDAQLAACNNIE